MRFTRINGFFRSHWIPVAISAVVVVIGFLILRNIARDERTSSAGYVLLEPSSYAPSVSTGVFRSGDSLDSVFARTMPYADIRGIARALKKGGAGTLQPGDVYAVSFSTTGAAAGFVLARRGDLYSVSRERDSFGVLKSTMPVSVVVSEASGTLESSLWEAMSASGVPPGVIMEFADIFAWEIDFLNEPRKGDRFALIWEERTTALGKPAGSRVTGAAYTGEETGEARAFYGAGSYYDPKGASMRRAFLRAPLSYRRISSHFSRARYHPILRRYRAHNGIDYAAPSGTPVSAVADGTVSFKGWKGGYGNFIELRHAGSYLTGYGHLRGFAKGLRSGARVAQGQVIGYVGSTGLSTGPHLDFSLKVNGRFMDFLKFRAPAAASLSGSALTEFRNALAPLNPRLDALMAGDIKTQSR